MDNSGITNKSSINLIELNSTYEDLTNSTSGRDGRTVDTGSYEKPQLELVWESPDKIAKFIPMEDSDTDTTKSGPHICFDSSVTAECTTGANIVEHLNDRFEMSNLSTAATIEDSILSEKSSLAEVSSLSNTSDEKLIINEEVLSCTSAKSFSPISNSEGQLLALPLDQNYSLIDKIDKTMPINRGKEQDIQKPQLGKDMQALLFDKRNWNIKVYIGEFKFYCNLLVLQIYSPYFKRCNVEKTHRVRLPLDRITPQSFHTIYEWMLSDEPPKTRNLSNRNLLELYMAAKFLGVKEITDAIWTALDVIDNDTEAFIMLPNIKYLDELTFDFLVLSRISRFFLTVVSSTEFADMDTHTVCRLLANHNIGVNNEIEVFYSALRWFTCDWPRRQADVPKVLKSVRFGLLPPVFLRYLQSDHDTQVLKFISQCATARDLITQAFIYTSAELYFQNPKQNLPFQLPEYDVPDQRRWIFDSKCPYHHDLSCNQRQFFTYTQFLDYLATLHGTGPDYWRNLVYLTEPVICCPRPSSDLGCNIASSHNPI